MMRKILYFFLWLNRFHLQMNNLMLRIFHDDSSQTFFFKKLTTDSVQTK